MIKINRIKILLLLRSAQLNFSHILGGRGSETLMLWDHETNEHREIPAENKEKPSHLEFRTEFGNPSQLQLLENNRSNSYTSS